MATHFSILAWKIPWTEESGRLQSMGSQQVGHDWATEQFVIHLIVHTSQSLTPILPCPHHWQPLVCFLYSCLFFVIFISLLYFLDSIYKGYYTVFVFVWPISLSITLSKTTIHVAVNGKISFQGWVVFYCIYVYMCVCTTSLSIHSLMDT